MHSLRCNLPFPSSFTQSGTKLPAFRFFSSQSHTRVKELSYFIPVVQGEEAQLHMRRFFREDLDTSRAESILMLHGAIENGRIFYRGGERTDVNAVNRKGLAPFLAAHGFDVFVGELRGRGLSKPLIS